MKFSKLILPVLLSLFAYPLFASSPLQGAAFIDWTAKFQASKLEQPSGVATDAEGNVYFTGSTGSIRGIADANAFQPELGGKKDAFIIKYSSSGIRLWSTYFGGEGNDFAFGITIDPSGNIFITGTTSSHNNMATAGAFQTNFVSENANGTDAFVAKFSSSGKRIWSTYFGGGSENATSVAADNNGNVVITGSTASTSGIASIGAFQTKLAGSADAFIAKFSGSGSRIWSTYFGGNFGDDGNGIATDNKGNIYITGQTFSSTNIASTGAFDGSHPSPDIYSKAFIAKFSPIGTRIWSSYFGGEAATYAYGIAADVSGNAYITGYTECSSGIASQDAWQADYGYSGDAFVAAFSSTGSRIWSTYLGGDGEDKSNAIKVYPSGNICIAGSTGSISNIAEMDACQSHFAGGCNDAFFAIYNPAGKKIFGTYYGQTSGDAANGLDIDQFGNIYIAGLTNTGPVINNDWADNKTKGGKYDVFFTKFRFKDVHTTAITIDHPATSNKFSGPQIVTTIIKNEAKTALDKVNIGWSINGINQVPVIWKGKLQPDSFANVILGDIIFKTGRDTLKTWTNLNDNFAIHDPDSYVLADTLLQAPNPHFNLKQIASLKMEFFADDPALSLYKWDFGDGLSDNFYNAKATHPYLNTGAYKVQLTVYNHNGYPYQFDTIINPMVIENEDAHNLELNVFPNPFQASSNVEYTLKYNTEISISLVDVTGKKVNVLQAQIQTPGKYQAEINSSKINLSPGVYLLKMTANGKIITRHIVYAGKQ